MTSKNAIGMIIFTNSLYLVGACLSAWVHRKFISKYNFSIDLVVMVDKPMYKYKNELKKYFDKVVLIDLVEIKLNPKYYVINKYSQWMKYSVSKWQILNFYEYEKILFIDIDILPLNKNFYEIFSFDTPAIMVKGLNSKPNILANPDFFLDNPKNYENNEYYELSTKLKHSLNAGFILLKPNKTLYNQYIDFLKICEGSNGFISKYYSGVDETTLLLFLVFYKKIPVHLIPYNYAPIPWDKFPYDKNKIMGINYLSMIKPWIKLPIIQWADENIWHLIAKKALNKHSVITKIYIKYLIDELYKFYFNLKKNMLKSNSPYNMESIKSSNLKNQMYELFDYLKSHSKEKLTLEQIKYIFNKSVQIHKHFNKKLIVPIDTLEEII